MAMTKAEMEHHCQQYASLLTEARKAIHTVAYSRAISLAVAAWEHLDGMMQYERKYGGRESVDIEAIHIVLRFAPLLFDIGDLDKLRVLLKNQRRIEKNSSTDLAQLQGKAREFIWEAHRLWGYLEQHPNSRQDDLRRSLGGDQDRWRSLAEAWEKMELLHRTPSGNSYQLKLITRMDEPATAKCPSCGAVGKAPKARFLEEIACPRCHSKVSFVIISHDQVASV
jgi:hypothetical protein